MHLKCFDCGCLFEAEHPQRRFCGNCALARRKNNNRRFLAKKRGEIVFLENKETKICRKCGLDRPLSEFSACNKHKDGKQSRCKACTNVLVANWALNNKERRKATAAALYQGKKGEVAEYGRVYREKNKNKELVRVRKWREANKDHFDAYQKKWNEEHPLERRLMWTRRKAIKKLATSVPYTAKQTRQLLNEQNHKCANPYCGADLNQVVMHLDHIMPLSRGGQNSIINVQWLCAPCNWSKNASTMSEFLKRYCTMEN